MNEYLNIMTPSQVSIYDACLRIFETGDYPLRTVSVATRKAYFRLFMKGVHLYPEYSIGECFY